MSLLPGPPIDLMRPWCTNGLKVPEGADLVPERPDLSWQLTGGGVLVYRPIVLSSPVEANAPKEAK